jgi:AcrR family transcriptional regulator
VYEASLAEFARQGVENARVEDIVAAAEVSWGTFFRYFPRKEDVLLEFAVEEYTGRIAPDVEKLLGDGDVPTRDIVETLFMGLTRSELPPHVHGAMLHEVMNLPTRFAELLNDGDEPVLILLVRVLRAGVERGDVRADVDPFILAPVLAAGTLFPLAQGAYGELPALREMPSRTDPEAVLKQVLSVAWAAIEAR